MNRRICTLGTIVLITASIILTGCNDKSEQKTAGEVVQEVTVVTTKLEPFMISVELPGRLEAYRQAEVRARVAGIVTERLYQEGQDVKKGTPLFLINPEILTVAKNEAAAVLAGAESNYANAKDKLDRYKDLSNDHSISERDYKSAISEELQAKAEQLIAKAKLDKAKLDLGYSRVTSPIDGRARRALVTEGALVGQDSTTPLTTVEQINPIYVNFSQSASDVMAMQRAVKSGEAGAIALKNIKVDIIFPDRSKYSKPGKLFFSDQAVDISTDTVAMRALFDNSEHELLPGAYVQVRFDQGFKNNTARVPRDALIRTAGGASVLVINKDNKVASVTVTADGLVGNNWIVTSGLKGGERVITSNPRMLAPGTLVKVAN